MFSLQTTGNPAPTVQWYFTDVSTGQDVAIEEAGPDSRYLVSKSGSLVIMETRLGDEGLYRAVVSNGAGEIEVEALLEFFFGVLVVPTQDN